MSRPISKNVVIKNDSGGYFSNFFSEATSKIWKLIGNITQGYDYLKTALNTATNQKMPAADVIMTQSCYYLTVYLAFSYTMYILRMLFRDWMSKSKYFDVSANRILLVIAHPDDECMFFGPLIVRLTQKEKSLFLLCLCNGPADGNGQRRKREFWASCRTLGMKPENIFLCNSSFRVEGGSWRTDQIATLVADYVVLLEVNTLVTFDKHGVTGNDNHIAVFRAMSYLNLRRELPNNCHIFLLDSMGYLRKYSSVVDVVVSLLCSNNVFILPPAERRQVNRALKTYKTQMRWYWRLYMIFSRYSSVNSLTELPRYIENTAPAPLFSFNRLMSFS